MRFGVPHGMAQVFLAVSYGSRANLENETWYLIYFTL